MTTTDSRLSFPLPTPFFIFERSSDQTNSSKSENGKFGGFTIRESPPSKGKDNVPRSADNVIQFVDTLTGAYVWIPHEICVYELARVIDSDTSSSPSATSITVALDKGPKTIQRSLISLADASHFTDTNNICNIAHLHEAAILNILGNRLVRGKMYTYVGEILITLNPYTCIDKLYDNPIKYLEAQDDDDDDNLDEHFDDPQNGMPHIFAVANKVLRAISRFREFDCDNEKFRDQSIIVTGESGSGKTEETKHVIDFFVAANDYHIARAARNRNGFFINTDSKIKDAIIQSNSLFEAFGNSKTVNNDNASRFGKFIKLLYTKDNQLLSAYTETFLLEKSRLLSVNENERNYHIFYRLIRGKHKYDVISYSKMLLAPPERFRILNTGHCTTVNNRPELDEEGYLEVLNALQVLGCIDEEINWLWEMIACVLHLGNIICAAPVKEGEAACLESPSAPLSLIASWLGVQEEFLVLALCQQSISAGNASTTTGKVTRISTIYKKLSAEDCHSNVQALMKFIYRNIFSWLVRRANDYQRDAAGPNAKLNMFNSSSIFDDRSEQQISSSDTMIRRAVKFICIVDIFGFEVLPLNSLEQLCINYTNERLQQQFNRFVFEFEQEIYISEGYSGFSPSHHDSKPVIDLISRRPTGLLIVLEGFSLLGRRDDDTALLNTFNTNHDKSGNLFYSRSRFGNGFIIRHFAGHVEYAIEGFVMKNNNSLQEDLSELLSASTNEFLSDAIYGHMAYAMSLERNYRKASIENVFNASSAQVEPSSIPSFRFPVESAIKLTAPTSLKLQKPQNIQSSNRADIENSEAVWSFEDDDLNISIKGNHELQETHTFTSIDGLTRARQNSIDLMSSKSYFGRINSMSDFNHTDIFSTKSIASTGPKRFAGISTSSSHFRNQLDSLMAVINITKPHYIRCIKPNLSQSGLHFQPLIVQQQLRYSGVLELVRMRREGFPIRVSFIEFYRQFQLLSPASDWLPPSHSDLTASIAREYCGTLASTHIDSGLYFLGRTMILLKSQGLDQINKAGQDFASAKVVLIQSLVRAFLQRRRYLVMSGRRKKPVLPMIRSTDQVLGTSPIDSPANQETSWTIPPFSPSPHGSASSWMPSRNRASEVQTEVPVVALELLLQSNNSSSPQSRLVGVSNSFHSTDLRNDAVSRLSKRADRQRFRPVDQLLQSLRRFFGRIMNNRRIAELHRVCSSGNVGSLHDILITRPNDVEVRDKSQKFSSVYHSAIRGRQLETLKVLSQNATTLVTTVDLDGNNVFHVAATAPSSSIVDLLGTTLDLRYIDDVIASMMPERNAEDRRLRSELSVYLLQSNEFANAQSASSSSKGFADMISPRETFTANRKGIEYVLKTGWLMKGKSIRDADFKRHWCILTASEIIYYLDIHDALPKGTISLSTCSISRPHDCSGPVIQVTSRRETKKKRFFGLISSDTQIFFLRAENEEELQKWLLIIRALNGSVPHRNSSLPAHYVNRRARKEFASKLNRSQESPLHILVRTTLDLLQVPLLSNSIQEKVDILACFHWLLRHGCSLEQQNSEGISPLDIARDHNNQELLSWLRLLSLTTSCTKLSAEGEDYPLLPKPIYLPGFSYLSLVFQTLQFACDNGTSIMRLDDIENPSLLVTVLCKSGALVVSAQEVPYPVFVRRSCIWWGHTYHFQVPLENIEGGDVWTVLVRLIESPLHSFKPARSFSGSFNISRDTVVISGMIKLVLAEDDGVTSDTSLALYITLELSCWCEERGSRNGKSIRASPSYRMISQEPGIHNPAVIQTNLNSTKSLTVNPSSSYKV